MKTFKNCTCYYSNIDGTSGENKGDVSFDGAQIRVIIPVLEEDWSGKQVSPGHFKLDQKRADWADLHMFPGEPSECTSLVGKYRMVGSGPDVSRGLWEITLSNNVVES
jgi:hypothetical protein